MPYSISKNRIRINFKNYNQENKKINLVKVQINSYKNFLQIDIDKVKRNKSGLEEILSKNFSIIDFEGKVSIDYKSYILESCNLTPNECMNNEKSYSCILKINLRLIVWYMNDDSGLKEIYNIKDQQISLTEIPLMTNNGTFIINGTQRVVVSQIHRSSGIIYSYEEIKNSFSKERNYSARIIPTQGSWLDFEFDSKNILYFRIDRKKKTIHLDLIKSNRI
jgi:DNA-directed RNA polymerase subunit beta